MLKVKKEKVQTVKLQRNNKIIERPIADYQANKANYAFRGFKVVEDLIKEKDDTILEFEPKVKNAKTKRTRSKSKKKIKEDL